MSRARGGISVTHIATDFPYQVELQDLWGTTPLPLLDLGKAADWIAPKRWHRANGLLRDGAHVRWAFSVFAEAEAFHARFGGRLVDAPTTIPRPVGTADGIGRSFVTFWPSVCARNVRPRLTS